MFYSKPKLIIDHGLTSLTMTGHSERSRRVTDDKSFRIALLQSHCLLLMTEISIWLWTRQNIF